MIKYKYKYTNTNTNTHTQIQIRTHKYKYKYKYRGGSEVKFWPLSKIKSFHEKGHISGTVRPTSLQHPSNWSSLRARPEKHLRGSLTCPGNTGEPDAPVSGGHRLIEIGLVWVRSQKKWLRQKSEFFVHFGSFRQFLPLALSKSCTGIPSERVSEARLPRNPPLPAKTPKYSCKASLNIRNGFSSKMNQNKR